jgi:hypothetical protein
VLIIQGRSKPRHRFLVPVREGRRAAAGGERCRRLVAGPQRLYSSTAKSLTFTNMPARDGTLMRDLRVSWLRRAGRCLAPAGTERARSRFLAEGPGHGAPDRPGGTGPVNHRARRQRPHYWRHARLVCLGRAPPPSLLAAPAGVLPPATGAVPAAAGTGKPSAPRTAPKSGSISARRRISRSPQWGGGPAGGGPRATPPA